MRRIPPFLPMSRIIRERKCLICKFYGKEVLWDAEMERGEYRCVLSNDKEQEIGGTKIALKSYEAVVMYKK